MRGKNRKGSTLIITIIIFVVLMIFGTLILGFMVNENKMSLNHQRKIQAYYIARAGAEVVEDLILNELDDGDKENLINMIDKSYKVSQVNIPDIGIVPVEIRREDNLLEIISKGTVGKITETVIKVLYIKPGNSITINNNFIVMTDKDDRNNHTPDYLNNSNIIFNANKDTYKPYNFDSLVYDENLPILPKNSIWGEEGIETNYYVDGNLKIVKKIDVKGKVNIFIKGNLLFTSDHKSQVWSTNESKENLNIYLLPIENDNAIRLNYTSDDSKLTNQSFKSNIYIGSGKAKLELKKDLFHSNIISNGTDIYLHTQTGNENHAAINGNIYAPNGTVQMDINSLSLDGFVVSNYLKLYHQNGKGFPGRGKLVLKEGSKQDIDKYDKPNIHSGYYK